VGVALLGGGPEPGGGRLEGAAGLDLVVRDAGHLHERAAQLERAHGRAEALHAGVSRRRRLAIPVEGGRLVLRDAPAVGVEVAEVRHGAGLPGVGGLAVPESGLARVFEDSVVVGGAQGEHGVHVPGRRGPGIPAQGLVAVARRLLSAPEGETERDHGAAVASLGRLAERADVLAATPGAAAELDAGLLLAPSRVVDDHLEHEGALTGRELDLRLDPAPRVERRGRRPLARDDDLRRRGRALGRGRDEELVLGRLEARRRGVDRHAERRPREEEREGGGPGHEEEGQCDGGSRARARAALERGEERPAVGGAVPGVGREGPLDRRDELAGRLGPQLAERRDLPGAHGVEDPRVALALERRLPGEALVEDRSDREDVGRGADRRRVLDLLERHVAEGPPRRPGLREVEALARSGGLAVEVLGEPEVRDEGLSARRVEDVLGLQVAVDDPLRVGSSEGGRERPSERGRLLDPERTALQPIAERPSGHDRHDDERSLRGPARIEERHEAVTRREGPEEPALPLEAGESRLVDRMEDLDRDLLARGAAGAVDGAGSALAEGPDHLVGSDLHAPSMVGK